MLYISYFKLHQIFFGSPIEKKEVKVFFLRLFKLFYIRFNLNGIYGTFSIVWNLYAIIVRLSDLCEYNIKMYLINIDNYQCIAKCKCINNVKSGIKGNQSHTYSKPYIIDYNKNYKIIY